jgi:hypothetical protein
MQAAGVKDVEALLEALLARAPFSVFGMVSQVRVRDADPSPLP